MKKIIVLFLTALIILTVLPINAVAASASPTFVVETVEGKVGDTVTVKINTKNNSGIVSLKLLVSYDADVLELANISEKDFAGVSFGPLAANPITVNWVDAIHPNNTTNGTVAELTFKILNTAPIEKTDIEITYDPEDVYDQNFNNVTFGIENGGVNVLQSHNLISIAEVPATCTSTGIKAHQQCDICEKLFMNGNEVEADDIIIEMSEHTLNYVDAQAPTCTEIGWYKYEYCTNCDYTTYYEIAANGHSLNYVSRQEPTCTEIGHNAYEYCTECDYTTYEAIPSSGHTIIYFARVEPKPGITGMLAHEECGVCCKFFIDGQEVSYNNLVIPALPLYESGWKQTSGKWWYQCSDGSRVTGMVTISGKVYYFDSNGWMQIGWQKIGSTWYYFSSSGAMQTNWKKIGGVWYYFYGAGRMRIGWMKISNVWYYFDTSGAMQTGWEKISNVWYYFNKSGAMLTGWQKIGGVWYYFKSSGAMATGWVKDGATWYYMASSGAMQTGWIKQGTTWYYLDSSGAMLAGTSKTIGGKTYTFNASGVCTNP